jgi:hypothetical protein
MFSYLYSVCKCIFLYDFILDMTELSIHFYPNYLVEFTKIISLKLNGKLALT